MAKNSTIDSDYSTEFSNSDAVYASQIIEARDQENPLNPQKKKKKVVTNKKGVKVASLATTVVAKSEPPTKFHLFSNRLHFFRRDDIKLRFRSYRVGITVTNSLILFFGNI